MTRVNLDKTREQKLLERCELTFACHLWFNNDFDETVNDFVHVNLFARIQYTFGSQIVALQRVRERERKRERVGENLQSWYRFSNIHISPKERTLYVLVSDYCAFTRSLCLSLDEWLLVTSRNPRALWRRLASSFKGHARATSHPRARVVVSSRPPLRRHRLGSRPHPFTFTILFSGRT